MHIYYTNLLVAAHMRIHTHAHKYVDVYGKNAQVLIYSFSKMGFDEQLAY